MHSNERNTRFSSISNIAMYRAENIKYVTICNPYMKSLKILIVLKLSINMNKILKLLIYVNKIIMIKIVIYYWN